MILYIFKEYERTVIFRLGRLLSGGARGPGVFFIIPCVDMFEKIDLRVQNFDVPPQEVRISMSHISGWRDEMVLNLKTFEFDFRLTHLLIFVQPFPMMDGWCDELVTDPD